MNIFCIPFWILISVLLCIVIVQKPLYQQIGSTCGFYALVYGISKVATTKFHKKKEVREIIEKSIDCGYSHVGEIFDINIMEQIVRKNYSDVNVEVVELSNINDLDKYLVKNYVIYPCMIKKVPHYVFLEKEKKTKYLYRHKCFAIPRKIDKEKFFQWHQNLEKEKTFKWSSYYMKKRGLWQKIFLLSERLLKITSDCELYKFLNDNEAKKRKELYDTETNVNMFGKILIISKSGHTSHQN